MIRSIAPNWRLLAAMAVCAVLYWPGLDGGYLFDDYPNVADNKDLQVHGGSLAEWRRAAWSSPSKELRRPLAMLSFAGNYTLTGLDPRPMKLTNLAIHLLDGALAYAVLLRLLGLWAKQDPRALDQGRRRWMALGIAAAWLLAPINLSPVLYVVQRMESLAQLFVLAGLLMYLVGRGRMLADSRHGLALAGSSLVAGTALGLLCKESAVLLPVYAFLLEVVLLRFAAPAAGQRCGLGMLYGVMLLLPALAGLAWLLPQTFDGSAFSARPFTLEQRLLTELRVLLDYVQWTLLPLPGTLSFYHDDIGLSDGWLAPPSTLLAGLALLGAAAAAVLLRRRLPLFSLGIGWYFAAHLLTATIIPLELVFEHRNYFASLGLLLAAAALLAALPPNLALLRLVLPLLALGGFAGATGMRAREWSSPVRLAYAEVAAHPDSPRANYELGRTLTIVGGYGAASALTDPALQAFQRAAALPAAGAPPFAALILVASRAHRPVQEQWWKQLTDRLSRHPASSEDIGALASLAACQHDGGCSADNGHLLRAFLAALGNTPGNPRLLAHYGAFAANGLGDYDLAATAFGDALAQSPRNSGFRLDLIHVLMLKNDHAEALRQLQLLQAEDLDQDEAAEADRLRRLLQDEGASQPERG